MKQAAIIPAISLVVIGTLAAQNVALQAVGKPVARVNGAILTDRDLLREVYTIFPYAKQHNGVPKAMEADIRKGALKMIVFEELVYQEAQRRQVAIAPARMTQAMADFRRQFPSEEEYQKFLKTEANGSAETLRAKVRRSLLIDQMLKSQVTDRAAVTLAEAKAYYDANPAAFRTPESFAFQSISVLPPANATPAQLKEAGKRASAALRQALEATTYTSFGLLAEKVSEDDYRVNMGDHRVVDRSQIVPIVAQTMDAMQPGQVSGLLQIQQAYTIVRLVKHVPAGLKPFAEVKDSLRDQLGKQKTEQLRGALDKRLRAGAKVEELI